MVNGESEMTISLRMNYGERVERKTVRGTYTHSASIDQFDCEIDVDDVCKYFILSVSRARDREKGKRRKKNTDLSDSLRWAKLTQLDLKLCVCSENSIDISNET